MPRIRIRPDTIRDEVAGAWKQLDAGRKTLAAADGARPGASARDAVFRIDDVVLYRYRALVPQRHETPLLIVYALVNRPDMADLQTDRSLVRSLLERGIDVYLIDWGTPTGADRALGLDDYINRYIDACVEHLRQSAGMDRINMLGICQGGTFSVCYAALNPGKIRNLITTVTPIDFHTPDDMLSHLFRHVDVDLLTDSAGNIPGDLLNLVFLSLKPFRLAQQKYVHLLDNLDDADATEMFMRMEHWIFDSPPLAGRAFREFAGQFYQSNALVRGQVDVGGRRVVLGAIEMPVLNIYAENDHLVPPAASLALGEHVGTSDYEALGFPGGHIGLYVSLKAHALLPRAIDDWLAAH